MRLNIQVKEKIADDWVSTNVIHEKTRHFVEIENQKTESIYFVKMCMNLNEKMHHILIYRCINYVIKFSLIIYKTSATHCNYQNEVVLFFV